MAVYDTIVVGAGIVGSATAHFLVTNGHHTLLLEQFPLPHTRGSSHGQSRIIRKAYTEEIFADMMREAYPMWEQLERDAGIQLYKRTNLLVMSTNQSKYVDKMESTLSKYNMAFTKLSNGQVLDKYDIKFYSDSAALLDHDGGILQADKALMTYQRQFVKMGGELLDATQLLTVEPGDIINLQTTKGTFHGRNVVLCLGSWAKSFSNRLGIHIPLKVIRISVGYFKAKDPSRYTVESNFPTFIFQTDIGDFYGLPLMEYPGLVKLALHSGPEIEPDRRDQVTDDWAIKKCVQLVKDVFPGLEPHPSIVEACIYTMTPDEVFVLDRHPKFRNLILAAGFSGHGFKLAPVTGKILGEMAMNKKPSYDLHQFRLDRFSPKSSL